MRGALRVTACAARDYYYARDDARLMFIMRDVMLMLMAMLMSRDVYDDARAILMFARSDSAR